MTVPHPIPYQGSKRRLAGAILGRIPPGHRRLVEPFAGSAAITLAAASRDLFPSYLIGDALAPLADLWTAILRDPGAVADAYEALWHRERARPVEAYYEIRAEFNRRGDPAGLLYLLARCVKNAVRFNPAGEFNQSPDKRRAGTRPARMRAALVAAHGLLAGRCRAVHADFLSLVEAARPGDFFYFDPPYQGTTTGRDRRYASGVPREQLLEALDTLNRKRVPWVLSYDGLCGRQPYGDPLPPSVARRLLLPAGRSTQATLLGRDDVTVESLYISPAAGHSAEAPPVVY